MKGVKSNNIHKSKATLRSFDERFYGHHSLLVCGLIFANVVAFLSLVASIKQQRVDVPISSRNCGIVELIEVEETNRTI